MTPVTLRPATPADSEFCFQLHKAAMGGYITAIWGWDEQRQRDSHTRKFNPGRWQIITAHGADIGMIGVEYRPAEIYVDCPIPRRLCALVTWNNKLSNSARRGSAGRLLIVAT